MKIAIVVAMQERGMVTDMFLQGMRRLMDTTTVKVLFSCSVPVGDASLAKVERVIPEAIVSVVDPGDTLGRKMNAALAAMRPYAPDYFFWTGCDDVYSPQLLNAYLKLEPRRNEVLGLMDIYMYDLPRRQAYYFAGYEKKRGRITLGAGRLIGTDVVKASRWQLWEKHRNKGMDASMEMVLKKYRFAHRGVYQRDIKCYAVDIKSSHNITPISALKSWVRKCELPAGIL